MTVDKRDYYEGIAEDVRLDTFDRSRFMLELRRAEIVADLLDVRRGTPQVLDVGCGEGLQLSVIAALNPSAYLVGLDLSLGRLLSAKSRVPAMSAVCSDIEESLAVEAGAFDRIMCSEVLEHLPDPARLLARIRAAAKPGSLLVVTVPFRQRIVWTRCTHCGRLTNEHLHSFDERNLPDLLRRAGFSVERVLFPKLRGVARTAFLPYRVWRSLHRVVDQTLLRKDKAVYMFCLARAEG